MKDDKGQSESGAEEQSPFALRKAFPDAQGIFDARYEKLDAIKDDCFVALDANVLLLPYEFEEASLSEVSKVYEELTQNGRLVIPAQAAREFAKHRSAKVAAIAKYIRDRASLTGPGSAKKIGALSGFAKYGEAEQKVREAQEPLKEALKAMREIADEISSDVGEDPVSIAYRDLFGGVVAPDPECLNDEEAFRKEAQGRYAERRPPGYKDDRKEDGGFGDLLIWKTILEEGEKRKSHCIFVTGDQKQDWYVQSDKNPFQPRLELLEEYRAAAQKTVHIIPLSRLLELFEADAGTIESVQKAEKPTKKYESSRTWMMKPQEWTDFVNPHESIRSRDGRLAARSELFHIEMNKMLLNDKLEREQDPIEQWRLHEEINSLEIRRRDLLAQLASMGDEKD
ncbi:PIN domain-containing protein [Erythrobacter sp. LQ02-29]|uniref:PIN domain-containing protein n=1 Tax=Erythrobacter sp. LQ02-29 TaxID=2920384 RepID=UPI001F4E904C|nr:PIN domain-containing protein [Erythrobacter sp. LQ02-29]MCP9222748.1 PIN domain-containing protein [Erythrobacter sp. LQ02-29]